MMWQAELVIMLSWSGKHAANWAAPARRSASAAVHQFGLRDRVNKAGMEVQYARRELLGFADGDVERIADLVLAHLAA